MICQLCAQANLTECVPRVENETPRAGVDTHVQHIRAHTHTHTHTHTHAPRAPKHVDGESLRSAPRASKQYLFLQCFNKQ